MTARETNDETENPMKRALKKLSLATMLVGLATPATAELYYYVCPGLTHDVTISSENEPYLPIIFDACGTRYYLSQTTVDTIVRACGETHDWRVTTTGRTRICGTY